MVRDNLQSYTISGVPGHGNLRAMARLRFQVRGGRQCRALGLRETGFSGFVSSPRRVTRSACGRHCEHWPAFDRCCCMPKSRSDGDDVAWDANPSIKREKNGISPSGATLQSIWINPTGSARRIGYCVSAILAEQLFLERQTAVVHLLVEDVLAKALAIATR